MGNRSIEKADKYYFAAYANMAMLNFDLALVALKKRCKIENKATGKNLIEALFDNKKPINNLQTYADRIFPWLNPFFENGKEDTTQAPTKWVEEYQLILVETYRNLGLVRNYLSHYEHSWPPKIKVTIKGKETSVISQLNKVYDGALNEIKKRFAATEVEIAHLRRFKVVRGKVEKRDVVDDFYYRFCPDQYGAMNMIAIAFFLSMFLHREYASVFLKKINGFKRGETRSYRFTFEAFTCLSTRVPQKELFSLCNDNSTLAMEIINELQKVPRELFETLAPDVQKSYRALESEDEIATGGTFIRFDSRFEYLALRYLSTRSDFRNWGFYTHLGTYYEKCYEKTLVDQSTENRVITHAVAGFTNDLLKNFDTELSSRFQCSVISSHELDPNAAESTVGDKIPFLARAHPSLLITNNNIGVKFLQKKADILPQFKDGKVMRVQPDYWLSRYEIVSLLFWALIDDDAGSKAYKVMAPLRSSPHRATASTLSETAITLRESRIQREIILCDTKIAEVERHKDNRVLYGKNSYFSLQAGRMAEQLMRDMVRLQPSVQDGRDKMTGANYQALQRSLAYYGEYRSELFNMFKKGNLVESPNSHPFLGELDPCKYSSLILYFKAYYTRRKAYFEQLKNKPTLPCHLFRDLYRTAPLSHQTMPIMLPRGIFNAQIAQCSLLQNYLSPQQGRANTSWLIRSHFTHNHGATQPFYENKRHYKYYDQYRHSKSPLYTSLTERKQCVIAEKKVATSNPRLVNEILGKEEYLERKEYNFFCNNESRIRLIEVQDMLCFMLIQKLLPNLFNGSFCLSQLTGILNTATNFEIAMSNGVRVVARGVKYRDYGKIARLRYDPKFESFLTNRQKVDPNAISFSFSHWERECKEYELLRVEVTKYASLLERAILSSGTPMNLDENHYPFLELMRVSREKEFIDDTTQNTLSDIRNAFFHNHYGLIMYPFYWTQCSEKENISFCKFINDDFSSTMSKLIMRWEFYKVETTYPLQTNISNRL